MRDEVGDERIDFGKIPPRDTIAKWLGSELVSMREGASERASEPEGEDKKKIGLAEGLAGGVAGKEKGECDPQQ